MTAQLNNANRVRDFTTVPGTDYALMGSGDFLSSTVVLSTCAGSDETRFEQVPGGLFTHASEMLKVFTASGTKARFTLLKPEIAHAINVDLTAHV